MEVIEIPGYSEEEKVEIGRKHLLPKQLAPTAWVKSISIPPRTWVRLVRDYTREAGVRQLEREIAAICRQVARDVVRGKSDRVRLTDARLTEYLGPAVRSGFASRRRSDWAGDRARRNGNRRRITSLSKWPLCPAKATSRLPARPAT